MLQKAFYGYDYWFLRLITYTNVLVNYSGIEDVGLKTDKLEKRKTMHKLVRYIVNISIFLFVLHVSSNSGITRL